MAYRDEVGKALEQWGHFVVRHRWSVIGACLALAIGAGAALPSMQVDNSVEAFLHEDDPNLIHYNAFRDRFGRDDVTVIAIRPPEIFDLAFLEQLRAMHEDLENEVPYLEEVTSLVNARSTRGHGDELIVDELMADWPASPADLAALRERVFANPLYLDSLISRDGFLTTVTLEPVVYSPTDREQDALEGFDEPDIPDAGGEQAPHYLTDIESAQMVKAVLGEDVPFHLTGFCTVMARAAQSFITTMAQSYVLALLIITPLMIVLLGSLDRGLLSMLPNLTPILLTLGLMGWLDVPLDMSTTLIGGIIIGLAVDDTIHFMDRFNRYFEETRDAARAIRETLETTGTAMLFTSIVLAAGFLVFSFAYMQNVVVFGLLCAFATLAAFAADVTIAPALMVLVTDREAARERRASSNTRGMPACTVRQSSERP